MTNIIHIGNEWSGSSTGTSDEALFTFLENILKENNADISSLKGDECYSLKVNESDFYEVTKDTRHGRTYLVSGFMN